MWEKEDFLRLLPRRKEFFRSRGLMSTKINSLEASTLDSTCALAALPFVTGVLGLFVADGRWRL